MYRIRFYETASGFSDILEFLISLRNQATTSKDARIQYKQVARYIYLLQKEGTNLPVDIAKYLSDDIWELRPGNNRVFFFYHDNGTYILLHHFRKKSQKTPKKEIQKAISEMKDYISRKEKIQ
jgi:phage-related protein